MGGKNSKPEAPKETKKSTKKAAPPPVIALTPLPPKPFGRIDRLTSPEVLHFTESAQSRVDPGTVKAKMHCIGALEGDSTSSMGCLLASGSLLTPLHAIYDLKTGRYRALELIHVFFVKGQDLYRYGISGIIEDGTTVLRAYENPPQCSYDYARLELTGEPLKDLGAGIQLDPYDHWGTSGIHEPPEVLTISAPKIIRDASGNLTSSRLVSIAENEMSQYYTFPIISAYYRKAGFSGQGIFPFGRGEHDRTLYGLHAGCDSSGKALGVKVSEYLTHARLSQSASPAFSSTREAGPVVLYSHMTYEVLTKQEIQEITKFLFDLKEALRTIPAGAQAGSKGAKKKEAPPISIEIPLCLRATAGRFLADTHQAQHLENGGRSDKTQLNPRIANNIKSPYLYALAECVEKIARHYYRKHRAELVARYCTQKGISPSTIPATPFNNHNNLKFYSSMIQSLNFVVDLGINISNEEGDTDTHEPATAFLIEGFMGKSFHIYPCDPSGVKHSLLNIIIDTPALMAEATATADSYAGSGVTTWAFDADDAPIHAAGGPGK